MSEIRIPAGETKQIAARAPNGKSNVLVVESGEIVGIGHSPTDIQNQTPIEEGDRVELTQENGDEVWAKAGTATDAVIKLNPDGLIVRFMNRVSQKVLSETFDTLATGQDTVAVSGTAEALNGGTSQSVPQGAKLAIKAKKDNTDLVYVGDSTVDSSNGFALRANEGITLAVSDVSNVWIDAAFNGEGVVWATEEDN